MNSFVLRLSTPILCQPKTRIDRAVKKWDVQQFSVSLAHAELQHPGGWSSVHKRPWIFLSTRPLNVFSDALVTKTQIWHHKGTAVAPVIPQRSRNAQSFHRVRSRVCFSLSLPSIHSSDNLWLPGLTGHLGSTLVDDRRARRGLTVQAEATDQVLQSRAFRFPLLQREREREKRWNWFLSVF